MADGDLIRSLQKDESAIELLPFIFCSKQAFRVSLKSHSLCKAESLVRWHLSVRLNTMLQAFACPKACRKNVKHRHTGFFITWTLYRWISLHLSVPMLKTVIEVESELGYAFCTDYHHETANPKIWKTHRKPTQKDYAEQTLETFCWIRSRKAPSTHSSAKLGWLTGIFIHRLFSRPLVQSLEGSPPKISRPTQEKYLNLFICRSLEGWPRYVHVTQQNEKFETIRQARFPIWTPPWRSSVFFSWKFWCNHSLICWPQ